MLQSLAAWRTNTHARFLIGVEHIEQRLPHYTYQVSGSRVINDLISHFQRKRFGTSGLRGDAET